MPVYISATDAALLTSIGADCNEVNLSGITDSTGTPYADSVFPVADYGTLVNQTPSTPEDIKKLDQVLEGSGGFLAALFRRVSPIVGSALTVGPTITVTTAGGGTELISYTHPDVLYVARKVLVNINFSCSTTGAAKAVTYWVSYGPGGASTTTPARFQVTATTVHQTVSQSWAITLPAIAYGGSNAAIKLHAQDVTGGGGSVVLNGDDSISLSIVG
jgi:hypothetical protein